jgi:hypothetical protein
MARFPSLGALGRYFRFGLGITSLSLLPLFLKKGARRIAREELEG